MTRWRGRELRTPAFSTKWPKSHALFNLRNCFFAWWSLITTRNLVPSMVISKLVLREIFRRKGICHFGDNACDILWNIINFKYTTLQRFSTKGCYLMISLASYNVICPVVKFKPIDSVNLTIMFVKSFIEIEDLVPQNVSALILMLDTSWQLQIEVVKMFIIGYEWFQKHVVKEGIVKGERFIPSLVIIPSIPVLWCIFY